MDEVGLLYSCVVINDTHTLPWNIIHSYRVRFLSVYAKNKTTVVNQPIYNGTTSGCSVLPAEVNRVSACTKSNNRFYLFGVLMRRN